MRKPTKGQSINISNKGHLEAEIILNNIKEIMQIVKIV